MLSRWSILTVLRLLIAIINIVIWLYRHGITIYGNGAPGQVSDLLHRVAEMYEELMLTDMSPLQRWLLHTIWVLLVMCCITAVLVLLTITFTSEGW